MSNFAPYDKPEWGSDVMVDVLRKLGLRYVSLNPGSSFRGLHDSLVNYGGDDIEMIECPHEKIAVALAHGYAKATGKPMHTQMAHVWRVKDGKAVQFQQYADTLLVDRVTKG